jgi:hypothetical protein
VCSSNCRKDLKGKYRGRRSIQASIKGSWGVRHMAVMDIGASDLYFLGVVAGFSPPRSEDDRGAARRTHSPKKSEPLVTRRKIYMAHGTDEYGVSDVEGT